MDGRSAGWALGGLVAAIVVDTSAVRHPGATTPAPGATTPAGDHRAWRPGADSVSAAICARLDRAIAPGALGEGGWRRVRATYGDSNATPVVDARRLSDAALLSPSYRIRQRPGPGNALGRVKFMFPNEFNVYLHDTPARALFEDRVRAHSHGCVRVGDPAALARFALADHTDWTAERIAATLAEGRRARAVLPRKIPVYLVYLTAFDQGGDVAFRDDLYDLDGPLMQALSERREAPDTEEVVARLDRLGGAS